jgi:hypothetical protein
MTSIESLFLSAANVHKLNRLTGADYDVMKNFTRKYAMDESESLIESDRLNYYNSLFINANPTKVTYTPSKYPKTDLVGLPDTVEGIRAFDTEPTPNVFGYDMVRNSKTTRMRERMHLRDYDRGIGGLTDRELYSKVYRYN